MAVVALFTSALCAGAQTDREPFGPSGGALFRPARPSGFGRKGVDVFVPSVNNSKETPFDLTECNAADCLMCDEFDKEVCVMCDGESLNPWLSRAGECVSACDSGDIKVKSADRGLQCIGCPDTNERECNQYCAGYRWDETSGNCTTACQLPISFGRNTAAGTCIAGAELGASESCTLECINGASSSVAGGLDFDCAGDSQSMTLPTGRCETIWDQVTVDAYDFGQIYEELYTQWDNGNCADLHTRPVTGSSFAIVDNALSALGLPNSSFWTLTCDPKAEFPGSPRFMLNTTESFELVVDKVTVTSPTIYFSKDSSWRVILYAESLFTLPDGSGDISTETMGVFVPKDSTWKLRTGSLVDWAEPFSYAWLENHGVIAAFEFNDGVGNSTVQMWSECTVSMGALEDAGSFSYVYGDAAAPNVVEVEAHTADIHTVIALVKDFEDLAYNPVALRDFYLTSSLVIVASDTDDVFIDDVFGTVKAGLSFGATAKIDSDSRLHFGLQCIGAAFSVYNIKFFSSDSEPDALSIVSALSVVEANSAWSSSNITMTGSWSSTSFELNVSALLDVELSKGSYNFPLSMSYDGTFYPAFAARVDAVDDALGFVGLQLVDVEAAFDFQPLTKVCSVYMTGSLPLADVGNLPLRGVIHSSAPKHSYWRATSTTDGISLGLDIVPWWNSAHPSLGIDDASRLEGLVLDKTMVTIATSTTAAVVFPTTDDGSKTTSLDFSRGLLLSGLQTHLDVAKGVAVELAYSTTVAANADLQIIIDSSAVDDIVDARKAAYTSAADADFSGPKDLDTDAQTNLSTALKIDSNSWKFVTFTPHVMTVDIPAMSLLDFASSSVSEHTVAVDLVVVWAGHQHNFELALEFADLEGDYIAAFLGDLAFQCTTDADCSGSQVCRHAIEAGLVNATSGTQTWHCVDSCSSDEFHMPDGLGCFEFFDQFDQCYEDRPCGEMYCIHGTCQPRYLNGESCTAETEDYCFSGFCCQGCGGTCQEYPLEVGFNCSLGLEFNECASGWCSSEEGDPDREAVCLPLIEDGETCDEDAHCVSGYCSSEQDTTCVTQYNVTGPCYLDDDCLSGLTCCWECGFECQPYPRPLGISCVKDENCESEFCSGVTFTCSVAQEDGEPCAFDDGCISGYCNPDRSECYTKGIAGDTCEYNGDCTGGYCSPDRNVCYAKLANDKACVYDSDCSSGWCTQQASSLGATTAATATCQTRYSSGASCSDDQQCKSNDCSASCTWFVCQCV